MSRFPYHRRYHEDALRGMFKLTLEQRGAYQTILDLIYAEGGGIDDDDQYLAAAMRVSVRKWRTIRDELIGFGKIWVVDGRIGNPRAATEIENQERIVAKIIEGGARGGKARAEKAAKTPRKPAENPLKTSRKPAENLANFSRDEAENDDHPLITKEFTQAPLQAPLQALANLPDPEPEPYPEKTLSAAPSTTPPAPAQPPTGGRAGGVAKRRQSPAIEAKPILSDEERAAKLAETRRAFAAEEAGKGHDPPATPAPDLAALQPEPGSLPQ